MTPRRIKIWLTTIFVIAVVMTVAVLIAEAGNPQGVGIVITIVALVLMVVAGLGLVFNIIRDNHAFITGERVDGQLVD